MLSHLFISNYALIDSLEIDFKKGLTIITGETGAGKSILLGALSLILGERADPKVIRDTDKKSVIEAIFKISDYVDLDVFFAENDIENYRDECIMRREISNNGRSRAFINDTPVTLSVLRDLSLQLIDIHSQHSNMLLARELYQLDVIDNIAKDKELLNKYKSAYKEYKELSSRLTALKEEFGKKKKEEDYIQFQFDQLSALKLLANEDVDLDVEQKKLNNLSEIKKYLWECSSSINDCDNSILSQLTQLSKSLSRVEEFDEDVKNLNERLVSILIDLKDISSEADKMQNGLVDDDARLNWINERLDSIYELENKHKVNSVCELLDLLKVYEAKLSEINNSDEEIRKLEQELAGCEKRAFQLGQEVSVIRKRASEAFAEKLHTAAEPLGMKNLRFDVNFSNIPLSQTGIDQIQFLFAFNKQQKLMPVENTASGGELSRLMLCIKSIIADSMQLPTIIFDEIDTGVSGDIANRMGGMMSAIASKIQVIAITHLPQVAVKGNNHLKVYKIDNETSTMTAIKELSEAERVREIAGMLSGESIDDAAINNAKSLLKKS